MDRLQLFFYTIMINDKFLNSNFMKGYTTFIDEAIRFDCLDEAGQFKKTLRDDMNFKIVKVNCTLEKI